MGKVQITKEDYKEVLEFILKLKYLWGGATIDFASSVVKRDMGKYIHDHMGGKLAEIAVKKYLKSKYNLNVELGFEKYGSPEDFMKGDIEKVIMPDGTSKSPKIKVEIKATKPSSRWWLISDNEFNAREYDIYILVIIDLPLDHIIRFFKDNLELKDEELKKTIPDFGIIEAEIKGIVWREEFKNNTLAFNSGDSVFETDIFEEKTRITGTNSEKKLENNQFILSKIPGSFKIEGEYQFIERKTQRKDKEIITNYIKTSSDVKVSHGILGDFTLQSGKIYLIINRYLSPLRIANKGYPLRSVPNKEETWKDFLEKLV